MKLGLCFVVHIFPQKERLSNNAPFYKNGVERLFLFLKFG